MPRMADQTKSTDEHGNALEDQVTRSYIIETPVPIDEYGNELPLVARGTCTHVFEAPAIGAKMEVK